MLIGACIHGGRALRRRLITTHVTHSGQNLTKPLSNRTWLYRSGNLKWFVLQPQRTPVVESRQSGAQVATQALMISYCTLRLEQRNERDGVHTTNKQPCRHASVCDPKRPFPLPAASAYHRRRSSFGHRPSS